MGEDDGISGNDTSECDCVKSKHDIRLKNLACEFLSEENDELDDDVALIGVNSTLALKMDGYDEDFCICRRCRTLSSSLSFKSSSYPDRRSAFSKDRRSNTIANSERSFTSVEKRIGSEEAEVNFPRSINVSDIEPTDDDPFILHDSYDTELEESEHCHVTKKSSAAIQKAKKKLMISSFLCLLFMLAEIIGGYLSNSLAVMTDAAHLLSDLASFLISLFAIWVGQKAPTRRMSFGYYRAEVLGAVMSVLLIWVLTGVLVYMAVDRVRYQQYNIDADVMLIVSGCGVAMNIIMGIVLHGPCGNHGHGHSHGIPSAASHIHESTDSHSSQNINVRAAFIHVVGDLVQSLGVLIAAYVIHYKPEYKLADPICTFIFSLLVMITTVTIMKDAVHVLMEGFPRDLNYSDVKNSLLSLPGVRAAHNLHIWSLTIDKNSLSVHLAVDPEMDPHEVLRNAQILVRKTYNIYHTTIQVEKYNPSIMADCKVCQGPSV